MRRLVRRRQVTRHRAGDEDLVSGIAHLCSC
jgi:hypothetical protein